MPMPLLLPEQKALDIEFTLNLNGSGSFSVVPLGRNSILQLAGNWPHPGFLGDFYLQSGKSAQQAIAPSGKALVCQQYGEVFVEGRQIEWRQLPAFNVNVTTPPINIS